MLHAIIMAGGAGTRFWPASRKETPKQLLDLASDQSMIQETVGRLGELVSPKQVLIVTNKILVEPIARQLPQLPPGAIVGEPCKRDTAPCVGLAAALVAAKDPDGTMIVMPADHVIQPLDKFHQVIRYAVELVEKQPSRIVTLGIKPTFPAASYGYIERGEAIAQDGELATYRVERFREKPTLETAQKYLDTGNFYWNGGIFVWKATTILAALEKFAPKMFAHIKTIADAIGAPQYAEVLEREFAAIEGTSIDYAVMENYDDIAVVETIFAWDDVGNWSSLARLKGEDADGNTIVGKHLGVNTKGTIVRGSKDHLIATLGVEDYIIVHTPDATLVASKKDEESIRQLVQMIKDNGWEEYM